MPLAILLRNLHVEKLVGLKERGVCQMIVSAALRLPYGLIVSLARPARHGEITAKVVRLSRSLGVLSGGEQGFLTETGEFVDRAVAAEIAWKAGQINTPSQPRKLYSEDIW